MGTAAATGAHSPPPSLLSIPLDVGGDWGGSAPRDALAVVSRMRDVSLQGLRLLSDRQPSALRVDNHDSGPPLIWLHSDHPERAQIVVDIGTRAWCQLAYQFGHELGHVLCNSWQLGNNPSPPSQWLEESMVEAFSLRGLGRLADSWRSDPPFPHNAAYASSILEYRGNLLAGYRKAAELDFPAWLQAGRPPLKAGVSAPEGPAVAPIFNALERDSRCVEDMGAVNRWPERTSLPADQYIEAWRKSCAEIGTPGILPVQIKDLLRLG